MKKSFTDLSQKRTIGNALLFYVTTFLLTVGLGFVSGFIGGVVFRLEYQGGLYIGIVVACVVCTYLTFSISSKKGIIKTGLALGLLAATPVLAIILGAIGGLIPPTILSTLDNKNEGFKESDEVNAIK